MHLAVSYLVYWLLIVVHNVIVQDGSTRLYQASFMGNTDEVKELLDGGADVNEQNDVSKKQKKFFLNAEYDMNSLVLLDKNITLNKV